MIKVYKIPTDFVSVDQMRSIVGLSGSKLWPIQDIDNNWIISTQEWDAGEFQYIKNRNPVIAKMFELIEYKSKPYISPIK